MGQKVNPNGFRLPINKDWKSVWFFASGNKNRNLYINQLVQDYQIRQLIRDKHERRAGISDILIEKVSGKNSTVISILAAKPGVLIGKQGEELAKLKAELEKLTEGSVMLNVTEVRRPETDPQCIALTIAAQIEKRVSYKKALQQAIESARKLVSGIRVTISGRLGGAEIARSESVAVGTIPRQTLKARVFRGFAEAFTTYGVIGIEVLVCQNDDVKTSPVWKEKQKR